MCEVPNVISKASKYIKHLTPADCNESDVPNSSGCCQKMQMAANLSVFTFS